MISKKRKRFSSSSSRENLPNLPAALLSLIISFCYVDEAVLVLNLVSKAFNALLLSSSTWCSLYVQLSGKASSPFLVTVLRRFPQLRIPALLAFDRTCKKLLLSPWFRDVQQVSLWEVEGADLEMPTLRPVLKSLKNLKRLQICAKESSIKITLDLPHQNFFCCFDPLNASTWLESRGESNERETAIHQVSIRPWDLKPESLEVISSLPFLQRLEIEAQNTSAQDVFTFLSRLGELKSLGLSNVVLSSSYTLMPLPHLESLVLKCPRFADLKAWLQACPGLKSFSLSFCPAENTEARKTLSLCFKTLARLSSLKLNWIPGPLEVSLWGPFPLTRLTLQGASDVEIRTAKWCEFLKALGKCYPLLKFLDVSGVDSSKTKTDAWASPEEFLRLESLVWRGPASDQMLGWISKLPALRHLTLENCSRLTDKNLQEIAEMKHLQKAELHAFPAFPVLERPKQEQRVNSATHLEIYYEGEKKGESQRPFLCRILTQMEEERTFWTF